MGGYLRQRGGVTVTEVLGYMLGYMLGRWDMAARPLLGARGRCGSDRRAGAHSPWRVTMVGDGSALWMDWVDGGW